MSDAYFFEIPATRGIQAGRCFYLITPPMSTLKRLIAFDTGNVLQRSQREVNPSRAKKISNYVLENRNSFVLPALSGSVSNESVEFVESDISPNVGILKINMDADVFLFDGQHRSTGIIDAVTVNSDLRADSAPIMLFVGMTLAERQQAFSDTNGYTVKPSKSISDTYNKRDDLPQLVVKMSETISAFKGKVDFERNVISKNSEFLFPIKTLKDATATLLGIKASDNLNDEQKELAMQFWTAVSKPLLWDAHKLWSETPEDFRKQYISSHGVFINALGLVGNILLTEYGNFEKVKNLSNICIKRNSQTFAGRCIDEKTGNMLTTRSAVKLTAIKILNHLQCPIDPVLRTLERQHFPEQSTIASGSTESNNKHIYFDLVNERWPELSDSQVYDICINIESIVIEFGDSLVTATSSVKCLLTKMTKSTTVKGTIRRYYIEATEG